MIGAVRVSQETPRALVFGARGTLGLALTQRLPDLGYALAGALAHADCDIADAAAVARALDELHPDVVFNPAAYTDVDGSELDPESAFRVNAAAPEILARETARIGARLVHYSTDYVFDGEKATPYTEDDPPSPQGQYARSKLEGERRALGAAPRVFVVRVGCLYGRGGRNFPSTLRRRLLAGETVRADRDRLGSPTWAVPVAEISAALARTDRFGLYHATAQGEVSWGGYARFMAGELGLPASRVEIVPTAALTMKAPRPRRAILDNRNLRRIGLDRLPAWQEQARAYLRSEVENG